MATRSLSPQISLAVHGCKSQRARITGRSDWARGWASTRSEFSADIALGTWTSLASRTVRWALRCDDPQQLAEIDAVLPHG